MKDDESNIYPPAVLRALTIMEHLAASSSPLSIKEISDVIGIPHASAYRIVRCLADYGYLRESPAQPDKYKIGYKLAILSKSVFDGSDLTTIAGPVIRDLASRTRQACQLCVINDNNVITIDQALPQESITIIAKLGEPIHINVSASGKILSALMPENKRHEMLTRVWSSYTANTCNTITDLPAFLEHLEQAARQLYATDCEEFSIGIGCLALPVFDYSNHAIAAIGLTGPIEFYKETESFQSLKSELLIASRKISAELTYSGPAL